MSSQPELTLHGVPNSHPVAAVEVAIRSKGLDYERVDLVIGEHISEIERIYGEGKRTVPGMLIDGEAVHGSHAIFERLDQVAPDPALYPPEIADVVRETAQWADDAFQHTARILTWGALHFRPDYMGTFAGAGRLDPAGTDFAITMLRRTWKYLGISASEIANRLAGLPGSLDRVAALAAEGVLGGESANAADLQIGSSVRLMMTLGDVRPLFEGHAAEEIALRQFPEQPGDVPAGAFPEGWVPAPGQA